jgi:hypothetical protein
MRDLSYSGIMMDMLKFLLIIILKDKKHLEIYFNQKCQIDEENKTIFSDA